jgi:hypothetical protein
VGRQLGESLPVGTRESGDGEECPDVMVPAAPAVDAGDGVHVGIIRDARAGRLGERLETT